MIYIRWSAKKELLFPNFSKESLKRRQVRGSHLVLFSEERVFLKVFIWCWDLWVLIFIQEVFKKHTFGVIGKCVKFYLIQILFTVKKFVDRVAYAW